MKTKAAELSMRRADERGHAYYGWPKSNLTFSFADHYGPAHLGFRSAFNPAPVDLRPKVP